MHARTHARTHAHCSFPALLLPSLSPPSLVFLVNVPIVIHLVMFTDQPGLECTKQNREFAIPPKTRLLSIPSRVKRRATDRNSTGMIKNSCPLLTRLLFSGSYTKNSRVKITKSNWWSYAQEELKSKCNMTSSFISVEFCLFRDLKQNSRGHFGNVAKTIRLTQKAKSAREYVK